MSFIPANYTYLESLNRQHAEILISIEGLLKRILQSQQLQAEQLGNYLNLLISSGLQTSPNVTIGLTIGITPVELARNDVAPSVSFNIANLDPAQPRWVGLGSVTTLNGRVIQARDNATFVVPLGNSLFGVCDVGTIQIVVSQLISLNSTLAMGGMKP